MIQATFNMDENENIRAFKVEGHAGYAPSGRDIVCAAVSSLVIGTINGMHELTNAIFETYLEDGITEVFIKESNKYSNVLLKSMYLSLVSIHEEYPGNIAITATRE